MSFKVYRLKPANADLSALFEHRFFDNVKGYVNLAQTFTTDPGEGDPALVEADEQAALDAQLMQRPLHYKIIKKHKPML